MNPRGLLVRSFAAALGVSLLLAACGSSSKPSSTSTSTHRPAAVSGGTIYYAEQPGLAPNYIFPMTPLADFSGSNFDFFQQAMYRPLYSFGQSPSAPLSMDYHLSVGKAPIFSDGDRTVTIRLHRYTWSDHKPVTSADVILWMNMLKAEKTKWAAYVPGAFPDNVVSYSAPNASTVVFHLNRGYNPTWFTYNELSQITPLPLAWDVTGPGKRGKCSTTRMSLTGCAAVYDYLSKAASKISTYVSSPLWRVVDGPWKLQSITTTGEVTLVPNPDYSGPVKPHVSKFVALPFTSSTAEFNELESKALTIGYIPLNDLSRKSAIKSLGYNLRFNPGYGFSYITINYNNPTVGPIVRQLYIRQALQRLVDQPRWISTFYKGAASPSYGPVPLKPTNPYVDAEERHNPYPFSVSTAKRILTSHGWKVVPDGVTTCVDPARCGPGIRAGEKLEFNLAYETGEPEFTDSIESFESTAASAGIKLNLHPTTANQIFSLATPCRPTQAACSWQLAAWPESWGYYPDFYPTGGEIFGTGGGSNSGSYSSRRMDALITATHTAPKAQSRAAFRAYENYAARELPVIYQPYQGTVYAVSSRLANVFLSPSSYVDPEAWYFRSG